MRTSAPWIAGLGLLLSSAAHTTGAQSSRVQLTFDPSEARAAIAILRSEWERQSVSPSAWTTLFATEPYQWLKASEAAFHRAFTDDEFRAFLEAQTTVAQLGQFERTLATWERTDMAAAGRRALAYLPPDAVIRAHVFPEIKPRTNGSVWSKPGEGSAIFVYLGHATQAQFENTVAHNCYHIGFSSIQARQDSLLAGATPAVKQVLTMLGDFGEGHAILAAAGGPDFNPHWADDSAARARWHADLGHFDGDLLELQQFFTAILDGEIVGDSAIQERASRYFGYHTQGPWFTVGYEMDVLVERRFGRGALIAGTVDPRILLVLYDRAARAAMASGAGQLSVWNPAFLARIGATEAHADSALQSSG